jgi:arylsulfatase A-like enzyme
MARLTDPWEIIRRQGDSKKEFDLDQIIDLYDGCVRNFDDEVRKIFERLTALGLAENTIVVIYSDHGMELFEHDTWGQGNNARGDHSPRVPLVIVDPRREARGVVPTVVRSIDVAPTLLELVGFEVPETMDGASLLPLIEGRESDLGLTAFSETGIWVTEVPGMRHDHLRYPNLLDLLEVPDKRMGTLALKPEFENFVVRAKDRMVRSGRWKLVYEPTLSDPVYTLYDVENDPECRKDLAAIHPDVADRLKAELLAWMPVAERPERLESTPQKTLSVQPQL